MKYSYSHGGLILILIIYAALSLYQLELPGLHYDEAFEVVPALQILRNQPVTAFRESGLRLGNRLFPLMTQDYIGALNTYTALPFIAWLGPTATALRLMTVISGGLTLWLSVALTHRLTYCRTAGLVAGLLLAVDPTFVFWNRQGIFVSAITATIGVGAAYCWLWRSQSHDLRWSLAGAFLFGLGLYAKLLFLWLIAAMIGAAILISLPPLWKILKPPSPQPSPQGSGGQTSSPLGGPSILTPPWSRLGVKPKEIILIVIAFGMGVWPLILYNLETGGTVRNIVENAQVSYYGVDNYAFGPNLLERLDQFMVLLDGSHLWYLGQVFHNSAAPVSFALVGFGVIIASIATRKNRGLEPNALRNALFPYLVIGLVILASIQTVSALWITHFALLMPWPAIALACGGWYVIRQLPQIRPGLIKTSVLPAVAAVAVLSLVLTNLTTTVRYHRSLTESGGLSAHSDAIYDLSRWLADQTDTVSGTRPVIAMDWGLAAPVIYLTGGQVTPVEVFGYAWRPDVALENRLTPLIDQPATFYLWRAPDEVIFDRSPEFKAFYRPLALEETIEEAFYERSGRPILGITRLVECGTPGIQAPEPADHCP